MPDDQQFGLGFKTPTMRPIDDLNNKYELAVNNTDIGQMKSVLANSVGTNVYDKAKDAYDIMQKGQETYDKKVVPFVQKLSTPDGRMNAIKDFQNVEDKPSFMNFVVETLLGNPNARLMATGGTVKPYYELGNDGKTYEVYKNELGKVKNVYDFETKQPMPQDVVARLQIGNPVTVKRLEEQQKFNNEALNAENQAVAAWSGFGEKSKRIAEVNQGLLDQFRKKYQFGQQELTDLVGFNASKLGKSKSFSDVADKLNQLQNGKATSFSTEEGKALNGGFKLGGEGKIANIGISGDGKYVTVDGRKANDQELNQLQRHFSSAAEQSAQYDVTQQNSAANKLFSRLTPEDQQAVLNLREYQNDLSNQYNSLKQKHDLPFLVDINAFDFLKNPNHLEATNKAIIHNADQIKNFSQYRDNVLKDFNSVGHLPQAGAIQRSYLGTNSYRQSADDLTNVLKQTLKRPFETPKTTQSETSLSNVQANLPTPAGASMLKEGVAPTPAQVSAVPTGVPTGAAPPKKSEKPVKNLKDIWGK